MVIEIVCIEVIFSALQNRAWANGRSCETHSTTVLSRPAARSLNVRVLIAHTAVSTLG